MQTSARNQFAGTVKSIKNGAVNSEIIIALAGGKEIAAAITCESVAGLDLAVGKSVLALVKAGSVLLATDTEGYAFSARNQLSGTIRQIHRGTVNAVVELDVDGLAVSAGITLHSAQALHLQVGQTVTALFKASAVVLAVKK